MQGCILQTKLDLLMRIIISLLLLSISLGLSAQLTISEYSASNMNQFPDNYQKFEDWIEVMNTSAEALDISGFGISDKESKPQKWLFPEGTVLETGEVLLLWCSGRDEVVGDSYHTNFKLTQTKEGEFVVISDANGNIIESHPLELTLLAHSKEQHNGEWFINQSPTPGYTQLNDLKSRYTAAPIIDKTAGFYTDEVTVSISHNDSNETIRYTLDGNEPTEDSPEYSGPITITETTVVKAKTFSQNPSVIPGKVAFNTYFINESFTVPVFSVAADQLQDLANGAGELRPIGSLEYFNVDGSQGDRTYGELNRHGQDSWVNPHRSLDWVSRDEMGYSKALFEPLFQYSDRAEHQRVMFRASGDDNYPATGGGVHEGAAHIRDEYVQVLAQDGEMKLDIRAVERAVVFLNGDYWGLYSIRERPVDHDYTKEYYNQEKFDLQYLLTWGDTWAEYGGNQAFYDWFEIRDFILENDMSDPANYQVVKDNLQVQSLMDYMIINLTVVSVDWMNYNTGWWRGTNPDGDHKKWGYILWDNDATFDYYINYTGVPNENPDAEPCDIYAISESMDNFFTPDDNGGGNDPQTDPATCATIASGSSPYPATDSIFALVINQDGYCCDTDWDNVCQDLYDDIASGNGQNGDGSFNPSTNIGKHEKLFIKLTEESPEFRQHYYSRQADLHNTIFSCEGMNKVLDSLVNIIIPEYAIELNLIIIPEMPRQIERWGGTYEEWESNVERLRDFVNARCELLDDGMRSCFDLTGPHNVTIEAFPPDGGKVELNTLDLKDLPWSGDYYGNMDNLIDADAKGEYEFVRWETKNGNAVILDTEAEQTSFVLSDIDTIVAVFGIASSVKEVAEDVSSFNLLPNVTDGPVQVQIELSTGNEAALQIINLQGQTIAQWQLEGSSHFKSIDLKQYNLSSGMYIFQLQTTAGLSTRKINFTN